MGGARNELMRIKPWGWSEGDMASLLDAYAHELAEQPPALSTEERQFLAFALDQAGEEMSLRDGFTDADQAALEKFRGWV